MERKEKDLHFHRMERLEKKGFLKQIHLLEPEEWKTKILADPMIPRSYSQTRLLAKRLYDRKSRKGILEYKRIWPKIGVLFPWWEECSESIHSLLNLGLQNPFLDDRQRRTIESDIDADMPNFEHTKETTHFILHWTDSSADAADNIADSTIIDDTADYLEEAWEKYHSTFGRAPYVPPSSTKIDVYFYDISAVGSTASDEGISLDSFWWNNTPGIRQPTSAHELFHRLQYAFGYRTIHTPSGNYKWFSEGTASWSEVFVWNRVSFDYKINTIFDTPDYNLQTASYSALPFWIFFDTRQRDAPDDIPLVRMLQEYEIDGDIVRAANDTIIDDWPTGNVFNQLDSLFGLFARERRIGAWEQTPTGGHPYRDIRDSDGNIVNPTLQLVDVSISLGDIYSLSTLVNSLGTDYYKFNLDPNTDGKTLNISLTGDSSGDFTFFIIWEKDGHYMNSMFPFARNLPYGFSETIDLGYANTVTLVVSGRMTGGSYLLYANVY